MKAKIAIKLNAIYLCFLFSFDHKFIIMHHPGEKLAINVIAQRNIFHYLYALMHKYLDML